jgi:hypothetical protein
MKSMQQIFNFTRQLNLNLKNYTMRNIIVLSLTILFSSMGAFSQKLITTVISPAKVIYNEAGVKISTKEVNCFDEKRNENMVYQMLILENETSAIINLKVKQELYYDNVCVTCPNDEYDFKYQLDPKEILEGTCDASNVPSLKIWDHQTNGFYKEVLTDFKLQVVRF